MPRKIASKKLVSFKTTVSRFSRLFPKTLPPSSRAAVGLNAEGKPAWFLFDTKAFWELMCRLDEQLFETLPEKEYDHNPVGRVIDVLEGHWPFSQEGKESLKREYEKALSDIQSGKVSPLNV